MCDAIKHGLPSVSLDEKSHLFDLAIKAIRARFAGSEDVAMEDAPSTSYLDLRVAIRCFGKEWGSAGGTGTTAGHQLNDAIRKLCDSSIHGGLTLAHLDGLSLDIWIRLGSEDVGVEERSLDFSMLSGRFGIEIEWGDAKAHFDPEVILRLEFKNPEELLAALCRASGLFDSAWKDSFCIIRKVFWIHLSGERADNMRELVALRKTPSSSLSLMDIQGLLDNGAAYLLKNQLSSGDYCYIYDALTGEGLARKKNTVRSSGCAYAMACAVQVASGELRDAAAISVKRAIQAILSRCASFRDSGIIVQEEPGSRLVWGKLGSTALLAVAMLKLDVHDYRDPLDGLLSSLKRAQRPDGFFDCFPGAVREPGATVNYYPGEALLALSMSADRGDIEALGCCLRAFEPYRKHFSATPSGAFLGWHVDVWSRLALITGRDDFSEFVFHQLDWILPFQVVHGPYRGGFALDGRFPGVASTVHVEAIIRGAHLAQVLGLEDRAKRYSEAAILGLSFCAALQLTPESTIAFPHARRMSGGVTSSLRSFVIRSDNVQHMMTMAEAAIVNLRCLPGLPPTHE